MPADGEVGTEATDFHVGGGSQDAPGSSSGGQNATVTIRRDELRDLIKSVVSETMRSGAQDSGGHRGGARGEQSHDEWRDTGRDPWREGRDRGAHSGEREAGGEGHQRDRRDGDKDAGGEGRLSRILFQQVMGGKTEPRAKRATEKFLARRRNESESEVSLESSVDAEMQGTFVNATAEAMAQQPGPGLTSGPSNDSTASAGAAEAQAQLGPASGAPPSIDQPLWTLGPPAAVKPPPGFLGPPDPTGNTFVYQQSPFGQVVAQQMEMAGAAPPQVQHSPGDPWQAHAESQPPPPSHPPPGWNSQQEQGGAPTTQTTTTGQPVSLLLHELGTIPEEGPVLDSPEWEILPDQL
ncbi:unnamed protein product [Prorocentrum cordatum]|uniref:Uncharacterized protein n=1 Tax=Prorocentrum cordatum TaxID=2364126 RepID=A0ABN9RSX0_9DINO|nr:unnamed protein product [Polarella glacialis]